LSTYHANAPERYGEEKWGGYDVLLQIDGTVIALARRGLYLSGTGWGQTPVRLELVGYRTLEAWLDYNCYGYGTKKDEQKYTEQTVFFLKAGDLFSRSMAISLTYRKLIWCPPCYVFGADAD
jgi:hypothetical protein